MCATGYPRRRHQKKVVWPASMASAARAGAVARQVRVAAAQPPRKTARGRGTGGVRRDRPRAHRARACGSNPRRRGRPTKGVTPLAAWGRLARPHGVSAPHGCARHADTPTVWTRTRRVAAAVAARARPRRASPPPPRPHGVPSHPTHAAHVALDGRRTAAHASDGRPQRPPPTSTETVWRLQRLFGAHHWPRTACGGARHGSPWGPLRWVRAHALRYVRGRARPRGDRNGSQRVRTGTRTRREARRQRPPARRGWAPRDAAAARRGGRPTHGGGCGCRGGGGSTPPRPTRRRRVGGWRPPPRPRGRTARRVARARLAWPWRLG